MILSEKDILPKNRYSIQVWFKACKHHTFIFYIIYYLHVITLFKIFSEIKQTKYKQQKRYTIMF